MNITLVKLKDGGFKGAEVQYIVQELRNGRQVPIPCKQSPPNPVHKDLENLFKDLRKNLLDICQITNSNMDEKEIMFMLHECEVTGVEFDVDGFVLHGKKHVFGNKCITLKTPKVEAIDEYPAWEHVMDVIKGIATETKLYMEGEKKVSDAELVERYVMAGKDTRMTIDELNALPEDEQLAYHTKILEEKFGSIVIHSDETSSDIPAIEDGNTFVVDMEEGAVIPAAPEKKSKKKDTVSEEEF